MRLHASALLVVASCWPATAEAQVVLEPGLGAPGGQTVPTAAYDLAFTALANGDFSGGLAVAAREYQGSIKAGGQRWIDSIATAAAVGECHYELGNFREAVAAYDEALLLSAAHADWLLAVQFPPQPLQASQQPRVATWGRSQRDTVIAAVPGTVSIRQGNANPQQVLQKGGVLTAPVNYPVRPQEIMRALVIALYRRAEILGELAHESGPLDEATKALVRRPAPPNHYSQSWIDIALGTAYWSQGKAEQAVPLLNRGLLADNRFDHALTSWGLIVLGRIALATDKAKDAARLFEEASYTAADHGDARALEESLRLVATAHALAGIQGVPQSIAAAGEWARTNFPALRMRLLASEAEARALAGDARGAARTLREIDGGFLRGDPGRGWCGAQAAYASALAAYAAGDVATGDAELERGLTIVRPRTPRLFQTMRLVEAVMAGSASVSDRQADALFGRLLGDPAARDFAADPLGMLAAISAPRGDAFEAWIVVAARRGTDAMLAAAEAAARSRWLATQPLGGRRGAIAGLVAGDPETLPQDEAARRAAMLARHPPLAAVLDKMKPLRARLTAALLAPAAGPDPPGNAEDWREYGRLAEQCDQAVAFVAAGRDPTAIDFPPLNGPAEIRRRLPAKHLILSFHWTATGLFGALESRDRVAVWQVRQSALVGRELESLARSIGLFDPVSSVSADRLASGDWRASADRIERLLFEDSKVALGEGIEELAIVPDGLLWYLPFELLPAESARPAAGQGELKRLREACRIRYCPTRSLAVAHLGPQRHGGPVGVYAGRLFRGDRPERAADAAARIAGLADHGLVLTAATPPPALAGSLLDALVVVDELAGDGPTSSRPLVTSLLGKGGVTFGKWTAAPPKRPQLVVLPGLQTAAAGGLSKLPPRPGEDVFLAATSLLAAGARTAVLSRWRVGGNVSVELMEAFVRDRLGSGNDDEAARLPSPAESWRRAVELVASEPPDLSQERRITPSSKSVLTDAWHPFFWAGYLLVDCGAGVLSEPPAAVAPAPPAVNAPANAAAKPVVGPGRADQ